MSTVSNRASRPVLLKKNRSLIDLKQSRIETRVKKLEHQYLDHRCKKEKSNVT